MREFTNIFINYVHELPSPEGTFDKKKRNTKAGLYAPRVYVYSC